MVLFVIYQLYYGSFELEEEKVEYRKSDNNLNS